jgi:hypothetical protein
VSEGSWRSLGLVGVDASSAPRLKNRLDFCRKGRIAMGAGRWTWLPGETLRGSPRRSKSPRGRSTSANANLANLDATIKLFSPGMNPDAIPPKRTYRRTRYFARNELSRLTQDALRTASGPLTSAEIAGAVMQAKGMPSGDAAFKEIVAARALTVLRRLAKRGTAMKSGTSRNAKWVLAIA